MNAYQQFINDPEHLARLEGQRYVVLRPTGQVPITYQEVKTSVCEVLSAKTASYPALPHVTLMGFPSGTPLDDVQAAVSSWAPGIPSLSIEVEKISFFPAPFQIVILQIAKTPHLKGALASLREQVREHGFPDWPPSRPSVDDWTFHTSLAYCRTLSADQWSTVLGLIETLPVPSASCLVPEVEVVAYDDGIEYPGGVYQLEGRE